MDCCNYMQYRHHQPYYGSQYYDPMPPYHGDFYNQQVYHQDYYGGGGSPYYPQQWPCGAASFPDYVYNPKEARIRKAMRDATRERSIGASPMLSRPNARRASHSWVSPHDELMMSPLASMRAAMEAPVCGGFQMGSPAGTDQFMGTMNAYNKLEPPPMPSSGSVHTNYMQTNPLAQLQQHAEMWPDYHQTMRPRSSGNPYMMGEVPAYHPPPTPEISSPMMMEKQQPPPPPPPSNPPPPSVNERISSDRAKVDNKVDGGVMPQVESPQDHFMPAVFDGNNDGGNRFDKVDESKMKKPPVPQIRNNSAKKPVNSKPLPDFNEAFGSTERGRFQSPPDPRLAPNKGYLDYFFDSSPIKFDDYQL